VAVTDTARMTQLRLGRRVSVDQFGIALLLLAGTIAISFLTEVGPLVRIAMVVLGALTVIVTLLAAGAPGWAFRAAIVVVVVAGVGGALGFVTGTLDERGVVPLVGVAFCIIASAAIVWRIASQPAVTVHTALGATGLFLLAGLFFAYSYLIIDDLAGPAFVQLERATPADTVYFSFVTLATLGYGDITPQHAFARMLATFETIGGQLYLVLIVAVIIGNLGRERQPRRGGDQN
jgi:hypothetical protein